ncbi:MAG TPA: pantetheine-phosphate adenylyltransferase [Candidatus Binataceae bacterium]|nr:pantetheine-phosphate adenylyltransferase [Candidatus Binataceae bacterium]
MNNQQSTRMRCAVYPGTFDPIHNGHIDIVRRAVEIFDEVIVAVAYNPHKDSALFSADERVEMIRESVRDLEPRARVDKFSGLSVEYAERIGARVIIRSLRAVTDFEYELGMTHLNKYMKPNVETIFLFANPALFFSASHLIKEVASYGQRLPALVPPNVMQKLREKFKLD